MTHVCTNFMIPYLRISFLTSYTLYYGVKKNQLDAQLILSIFRQPLHVSNVSMPIIRRYNRMYTTIRTFFLDVCLLSWLDCNPTRTTDSHLKRIISTNCCIRTVVPPDDGARYVRNMQRLTIYSKNKLCIKLGSLYTIVSRYTINKQKILYYSCINLFVLYRVKMGHMYKTFRQHTFIVLVTIPGYMFRSHGPSSGL